MRDLLRELPRISRARLTEGFELIEADELGDDAHVGWGDLRRVRTVSAGEGRNE